jgi:hypothetical protein
MRGLRLQEREKVLEPPLKYNKIINELCFRRDYESGYAKADPYQCCN